MIHCEVNLDYCEEKNIEVARRISGGGAVYHDIGNLNIALIGRKDLPRLTQVLHSILLKLGIKSVVNLDNSICYKGFKISGYARASNSSREIQHSTLLYDCNLESMKSALESKIFDCEGQIVKSKKSNVNNIKTLENLSLSSSDFFEYCSNLFAEELDLKENIKPEINYSIVNRFSINRREPSWIYKSSKFCFFSVKLQEKVMVELNENRIISFKFITNNNQLIESSFVGMSVLEII